MTLENGQIVTEDLLSVEEEEFVLAVVERGGNIGQAYRDVFTGSHVSATARAQDILRRPAVARRLAELRGTLHEAQLITLESHLVELADIRDIAKAMGQIKIALEAEKSRGTVIGLYQAKGENTQIPKTVSHLEKLAERVMGMMPSRAGAEDAVIVHASAERVQ